MNLKGVLRLLILSAFICGQIGGAAHAHVDHSQHEEMGHHRDHNHHEHNHDRKNETEHELCGVCILAVNEGEDGDVEDVYDTSGAEDGPDFLTENNALSFCLNQKSRAQYILPVLNLSLKLARSDLARAPPEV